MASRIIMVERGVYPKDRKKNIEGVENREAKRIRTKIAADAVVYEQDKSPTITKTIGDGSVSEEVVNDISQKPPVPDEACFSGTGKKRRARILCLKTPPTRAISEHKLNHGAVADGEDETSELTHEKGGEGSQEANDNGKNLASLLKIGAPPCFFNHQICKRPSEEEPDLCEEDFLCFPSSPDLPMYERKPRQLMLTCPLKKVIEVDFSAMESCETLQDAIKAGYVRYV